MRSTRVIAVAAVVVLAALVASAVVLAAAAPRDAARRRPRAPGRRRGAADDGHRRRSPTRTARHHDPRRLRVRLRRRRRRRLGHRVAQRRRRSPLEARLVDRRDLPRAAAVRLARRRPWVSHRGAAAARTARGPRAAPCATPTSPRCTRRRAPWSTARRRDHDHDGSFGVVTCPSTAGCRSRSRAPRGLPSLVTTGTQGQPAVAGAASSGAKWCSWLRGHRLRRARLDSPPPATTCRHVALTRRQRRARSSAPTRHGSTALWATCARRAVDAPCADGAGRVARAGRPVPRRRPAGCRAERRRRTSAPARIVGAARGGGTHGHHGRRGDAAARAPPRRSRGARAASPPTRATERGGA